MEEILKSVGKLLRGKKYPRELAGMAVKFCKFKDDSSDEDIKKGVDDFIEFYKENVQPENERRVNSALENFQKKHKIDKDGKKIEDDEDEDETEEMSFGTKLENDKKKGEKNDLPDSVKGIFEKYNQTFEKLNQSINELKAEKVLGDKRSEASKLMSKSKVPKNLQEKWMNRIDFASETPVSEQIEEMETEIEELNSRFQESFIDENNYTPSTPSVKSEADYLNLYNDKKNDESEDSGIQKVEFSK